MRSKKADSSKQTPSKEGSVTVCGLFDKKREQILANRADFLKKLAGASELVHNTYRSLQRKVNRASKRYPHPAKGVEVVLYQKLFRFNNPPLYLVRVVALLRHPVKGWDVKIRTIQLDKGFLVQVVLRLW